MEAAFAPLNEDKLEHLACLQPYQILETKSEPVLDDLVELAALCCDAPMAWLALVDVQQQWLKASLGISRSELRRERSLGDQVIRKRDLFWLPDARADLRFQEDPLVRSEPQLRFFAGVALLNPVDQVLGYLAVADPSTRSLSETQAKALRALGRQAVQLLEERRKSLTLKRIEARKERFLQLISQDLKKPFSAVLGFSAALQEVDGLSNEQLQLALMRIHGAAQSAYAVLNNLLLWSRYELGAINFSPRWIQFSDVLDNLMPSLGRQARAKDVNLLTKVAQDASFFADWRMSLTVVGNLLDNAIKYSYMQGQVEILVRNEAQSCVIRVQDQGTGITPDRMQQLFQLTSEQCCEGTAGERGTGLGLLLSKDFMTRHGGRIWAESKPGQGSCFYLSFPHPGNGEWG